MSSRFQPREVRDVARFIQANPIGLVVSHGPRGFASTPLPLLPSVDGDGAVTELFGHYALSNPQVAILRETPAVHIIFQGPHAYVQPRWVSRRSWAPTWNYAVVRFDAELRFVPEENGRAIAELVAAMEGSAPDAWTTADMGDRYEQLLSRIIAFRARVTDMRATFKLGQDEDPDTLREILAGLGEHSLAALMAEQNQEKLAG